MVNSVILTSISSGDRGGRVYLSSFYYKNWLGFNTSNPPQLQYTKSLNLPEETD
jgi:hypothetical protein